MKRLVLLVICFQLYFSSIAQSSNNTIRYVYSSCTDEGKKELFELLKNDKLKLKQIYNNYYDACKNGKIVLSTNQYAPIAQAIEQFKSNENIINDEVDIYAKIAKEKYILVTDLITKQ
tara:strand:- start:14825 stop:15178 length:354 start_codon:yes stop_codon:yes gene_type:complete